MYIVNEIIETDREGNKKEKSITFNSTNQAKSYIVRRMKEIIKVDTLKFFRIRKLKITNKLTEMCQREFDSWIKESDGEQFPYVASYLGWSCFWIISIK